MLYFSSIPSRHSHTQTLDDGSRLRKAVWCKLIWGLCLELRQDAQKGSAYLHSESYAFPESRVGLHCNTQTGPSDWCCWLCEGLNCPGASTLLNLAHRKQQEALCNFRSTKGVVCPRAFPEYPTLQDSMAQHHQLLQRTIFCK
jgi:hypothetical protein